MAAASSLTETDLPDDSIPVGEAARRVSCHPATIYRALGSGALRGHRLNGKRRGQWRVYLWSLARWQQATDNAPESERRLRPVPRRRAAHKAHASAVDYLREAGVI